MPRSPDRNPNQVEYAEDTQFVDVGLGEPTVAGTLRYHNNSLRIVDGIGSFDARRPWHALLDGPTRDRPATLYKVITGTVAPSQVAWYADAAKTQLICMVSYTYSPSNAVLPISIVYRLYNTDGSIRMTCTDTISYTGGVFENGRVRVFS